MGGEQHGSEDQRHKTEVNPKSESAREQTKPKFSSGCSNISGVTSESPEDPKKRGMFKLLTQGSSTHTEPSSVPQCAFERLSR